MELPAHLFSDAHEPMREDAKLNGVQLGGDNRLQALTYCYLDIAARRDRRCAIGFDQKGAQAVHDNGWAIHRMAW